MNTLTGIPFRNMINRQVIVADERTLKLVYPAQVVTIMGTGWGDYHVIVEEGGEKKTNYSLMDETTVNDIFDIDIKQY